MRHRTRVFVALLGDKRSLDRINHYMKVAGAVRFTIELQAEVDEAYARSN